MHLFDRYFILWCLYSIVKYSLKHSLTNELYHPYRLKYVDNHHIKDTSCFSAQQTACENKETNPTITVDNGTQATLHCATSHENYPAWVGPHNGTLWTFNYRQSPKWRPYLGTDKISRLGWSTDKRSLVIKPVTFEDNGQYTCFGIYYKSVKITLTVRGI